MIINRAHQFFVFFGGAGWHVHVHVVQLPIHPGKKNPQEKLCFIKR